MKKFIIILMAGLAGFSGMVNPVVAGFFSTTGPVIAIFAGELYLGVAQGNYDGSGTIKIHSVAQPNFTCVGQFTSSAKLGGIGNLQCNDNSTATIKFKRLSLRRGYGTGNSPLGSLSFTYGLNANESTPYLKLPPGKALKQNEHDVEFVDDIRPKSTITPLPLPTSLVPENVLEQIPTPSQ